MLVARCQHIDNSYGVTVRKVLIYLALVVVLISIIGFLSISNKRKNSEIKALKSEIESKEEKINAIRTEIDALKKEMESEQRAGKVFTKGVIEAGGEYAEKINIIQSDKSAVDWLDQPLPDAVVYNYSSRICANSGN